MKKYIFWEILKLLNSDPKLQKKLKYALIFGVGALVIGGVVAVWASVKIINYATNTTSEIASSQTVQQKISSAQREFDRVSFKPVSCWDQAMGLLTIEPWIQNPVLVNLNNLKTSCMDIKPKACEKPNCGPANDHTSSAERRPI